MVAPLTGSQPLAYDWSLENPSGFFGWVLMWG